ncbi:alpha/beta-hydrolase [Trametopsis cervina]|nr:alpha/beta-hydrolase [Trametopsis cervina]
MTATQEKSLDLGDGLTLAYEEIGYPSSSEVVIFFHGVLSVGMASEIPPAFEARHIHFIAPTLPGWGNSSPVPRGVEYHDYLYRCIDALLRHLHPDKDDLRLYISGGSFGTVVSQIIYGAPYDKFPYGRQIVAMLLIAPFSPPHHHKEFNKSLSLSNWIAVGTPAKVIPFKLFFRLGIVGLKTKVNTPEAAKKFINDYVFEHMKPNEMQAFVKWKHAKGLKDGEELDTLADGVYRSTRKTWAGLLGVSDVIHSNWGGYNPAQLDEEHTKPVFFCLTKEDKDTLRMGEWLAGQLRGSLVRYEEGGHVGSLFVMDDIWEDFLARYCGPATVQ